MNSLNFIFCTSSNIEVEMLISSVYQTISSILMKDRVSKIGVIKLKHCNEQKQKNLYRHVS
jgi:hypothetical protein